MKLIFGEILILAVFLAVINFHAVPKLFHETFGLIISFAISLHIYKNRRWFFSLRQGKWSGIRILATIVNFSLIILFLIVIITGACISNHIFKDIMPMSLQRNLTFHQPSCRTWTKDSARWLYGKR